MLSTSRQKPAAENGPQEQAGIENEQRQSAGSTNREKNNAGLPVLLHKNQIMLEL
jgi:hypothetical protein